MWVIKNWIIVYGEFVVRLWEKKMNKRQKKKLKQKLTGFEFIIIREPPVSIQLQSFNPLFIIQSVYERLRGNLFGNHWTFCSNN